MNYEKQDAVLFQEIQKFTAGNQESFEKIYELSKRYIYKIINDIVNNYDTTEDIMQETYLRIYNKINTLQDIRSFYTWAGRIATNLTLDYIRKNRNEVLLDADKDSEDDSIEFIFDKAAQDNEEFIPENIIMDKEKQRLISEILDSLSVAQKLSVQYFYYEEMSVSEIAQTMNCSEGTVKSRLNYARKAIKKEVLNLEEKKGTKLYSLGGLSLLLLLFRQNASEITVTCPVPAIVAKNRAEVYHNSADTTSELLQKAETDEVFKNKAINTAASTVKSGAGIAMKKIAVTIAASAGTAMLVAGGIKAVHDITQGKDNTKIVQPAFSTEETKQINEETTHFKNINKYGYVLEGDSNLKKSSHLTNKISNVKYSSNGKEFVMIDDNGNLVRQDGSSNTAYRFDNSGIADDLGSFVVWDRENKTRYLLDKNENLLINGINGNMINGRYYKGKDNNLYNADGKIILTSDKTRFNSFLYSADIIGNYAVAKLENQASLQNVQYAVYNLETGEENILTVPNNVDIRGVDYYNHLIVENNAILNIGDIYIYSLEGKKIKKCDFTFNVVTDLQLLDNGNMLWTGGDAPVITDSEYNMVTKFTKSDYVKYLKKSRSMIFQKDKLGNKQDNPVYLMSDNGEIVSSGYMSIEDLTSSLLLAKNNNGYAVINKKGQELVNGLNMAYDNEAVTISTDGEHIICNSKQHIMILSTDGKQECIIPLDDSVIFYRYIGRDNIVIYRKDGSLSCYSLMTGNIKGTLNNITKDEWNSICFSNGYSILKLKPESDYVYTVFNQDFKAVAELHENMNIRNIIAIDNNFWIEKLDNYSHELCEYQVTMK